MKIRLMMAIISGIAFAQQHPVADPIKPVPDKLRADILQAHRDQLQAEKDKQSAMMAYHEAESRFEAAKHNLTILQNAADQLCGTNRKFNLDKAKCQ